MDKVIEAKTNKFRPKNINLTNIGGVTPRDDSLLRTSDRLGNIELENTREIRESEQVNKRYLTKHVPLMLNNSKNN